ncbi:MAG: hypothetical protein RLZZ118_568 [Bacteroidota bacterium]|jgi:hypothetical protein
MLLEIHPKLPMRNKAVTMHYYMEQLGFTDIGSASFDDYLIVRKDNIEIHFFSHKNLDVLTNDGQVYIRTNNIDELYQQMIDNQVAIHPNGNLVCKPWGQKEFALLDPDHNLLTFGQAFVM